MFSKYCVCLYPSPSRISISGNACISPIILTSKNTVETYELYH